MTLTPPRIARIIKEASERVANNPEAEKYRQYLNEFIDAYTQEKKEHRGSLLAYRRVLVDSKKPESAIEQVENLIHHKQQFIESLEIGRTR